MSTQPTTSIGVPIYPPTVVEGADLKPGDLIRVDLGPYQGKAIFRVDHAPMINTHPMAHDRRPYIHATRVSKPTTESYTVGRSFYVEDVERVPEQRTLFGGGDDR